MIGTTFPLVASRRTTEVNVTIPRQEILETVALAVYMGGGPAAVYGGDAVRAYDQFSKQQTA